MKKKMILKKILVCFLSLVIFLSFAKPVSFGETSGETLKKMGLVIGFADGSLHENRVMKQGELVALISRYIIKNYIKTTYTAIEEKNVIDVFVNKVFNFVINAYYSVKRFLIKSYYVVFNKEIYPGVSRNHYLFNYLVILKTYGYGIKGNFDVNSLLTADDFFRILFDMLDFGESEFKENTLDYVNKTELIDLLHGKKNSSLFKNKGFLKRGEVFAEFLRLLK
ncbi:MAG: hypothetical protein K6343_04835 [Caldisericaceae bacterium]